MDNEVAENFVMSYYEMLQNNPENVRPFFLDNSIMVRIGGNMHALANTIPDIMGLVGSLGNMIFEIKSKESLPYINGGCIVQVSGSVHTLNERKKFHEIFFLAFHQNEYLIHRDIFEYDEENPDSMSDASSQEVPEVAQEEEALSSPMREPPTVEVASSDGPSSLNSGEDTKLYIGNLPKGYDNAEVAKLVREVASPVLVQVGHAKRKSRKGYAFVTMVTVEERDLVIAHLNGKKCGDRILKASFVRNHTPRGKSQHSKAR